MSEATKAYHDRNPLKNGWTTYNYKRRQKDQPEVSFEEYCTIREGFKTQHLLTKSKNPSTTERMERALAEVDNMDLELRGRLETMLLNGHSPEKIALSEVVTVSCVRILLRDLKDAGRYILDKKELGT